MDNQQRELANKYESATKKQRAVMLALKCDVEEVKEDGAARETPDVQTGNWGGDTYRQVREAVMKEAGAPEGARPAKSSHCQKLPISLR